MKQETPVLSRVAQLRQKIVSNSFQKVFITFITYRLCFFLLHLVTFSFGVVNNDPNLWYAFPDNPFFDSFFKSDSGWYQNIIQNGYSYVPGKQSNVAFFPLYPLLIKLLMSLTNLNLYVVGFLISNTCLLFGLYFVYKISLLYLRSKEAQKVLILMLVFPTSFFYSALYTESLYLLVISASFYYYLDRQYLFSGIWGFLACLTRVTGIILFVALVIDIFVKIIRNRITFKPQMLYLCIIPLGLVSYMLFSFFKFQDPLIFVNAQDAWNREGFIFPLITLFKEFQSINFYFPRDVTNSLKFIDLLFSTAFLFLSLVLLWKNKLNISLPIFCIFSIIIPLSTGVTHSMARYVLPLFPVFIYLGLLSRNNNLYTLFIFSFGYLLSIFFLWFAGWNSGIW